MDAPQYEEIDHTADVGIRVTGATLEELFRNAAMGMTAIILSDSSVSLPQHQFEITVRSETPDELLREWLAELLYVQTIHHVLCAGITDFCLTERSLHAVMHAVPMTPEMMRNATEIKAVTYHGLSIRERNGGFEAQIIFDT